ncbi:2-dehydro-3-deoxygalactonokinase [Devosia rhodophyticola]|uniref:2-dehydro-3-deoxygalactonokinase n=1 Tax=Devosia rhodophyticola TaxID=3026423 RepID=A0ABY7YX48_9HYPH|nr:2-dehydro-3-deoxygalactonokinase [Devosia rhodophyticola]WDR05891.1 2-dehydro-3-deoxygalactonokinase [Devosia rhodophyticola]
MTSKAEWIAVDWGTSNLRAWGIDASGEIVFSRTSPKGMGKLDRDDYPAALSEVVAGEDFATSSVDVLICGMAGARQGWIEAPYLDAPANLQALANGAVQPKMPNDRLRPAILPGVCQKTPGNENVMRGEETQLLGLSALIPNFDGVVCMPGTHSKWVALSGARISRFATAMTGELYEVLRTHSVLRHSLNGDLDGPDRDAGFDAGVDVGLGRPDDLLGLLFGVRAGSLLSNRQPDWCAGYLSGLLIGSEIGGHRDWLGESEVPLIGATALCELYKRALSRAGAKSRLVDATEAVLTGLKAARQFAA